MATANLDLPELPQFDHTKYYCEENVYLLIKKLSASGIANANGSDLYVVFISNDKKQVPLWHQKASQRADGVVLWDYHVICIQKRRDENSPHLVWDLDSSLPFPSPLQTYLAETFQPSFQLFAEYKRFFRVVHAPVFRRLFASDRRHMKDSAGNWTAQPPQSDPIVGEDGTVNNLNEYIEVHGTDVVPAIDGTLLNAVYAQKLGVVLSEDQLEEFFSLSG